MFDKLPKGNFDRDSVDKVHVYLFNLNRFNRIVLKEVTNVEKPEILEFSK